MRPTILGGDMGDHGVGPLASDHDGLLAAIDRFQGLVLGDEAAINTHIGQFVAEIYHRFQIEERLMEDAAYPLADIHTREHNRILAAVTAAMRSGAGGRFPITGVAESLRVVFGVHVEHFDAVLSQYLRKKRAS